MLKRTNDFIFVKCADKKTAQALRVGKPPEVRIYDCEGELVQSWKVKTAADVTKAMEDGLTKYADKAIDWNTYDEGSLESAKNDKKLVILFFSDDKKDSEETAKALEDRCVAKYHAKLTFIKIAYARDSDDCKRWGANTCPMVMLVDPNKEAGSKAIVDKLSGKQKATALRGMISKGLEKVKAGERR